jgi:hypothetical protein
VCSRTSRKYIALLVSSAMCDDKSDRAVVFVAARRVVSHIWRVLCNVSMLFAHAQNCQGQYISNACSAETKETSGKTRTNRNVKTFQRTRKKKTNLRFVRHLNCSSHEFLRISKLSVWKCSTCTNCSLTSPREMPSSKPPRHGQVFTQQLRKPAWQLSGQDLRLC